MKRGLLVLAVTALVGGCGPAVGPAGEPAVSGEWRWESYGGVEVSVPADWGWGFEARMSRWCSARDVAKAVVERPGPIPLDGCVPPAGETPWTLVARTGLVLAFARTTDPDGTTQQNDRSTVRIDGVQIDVNAPAELRQQIVTSIRPAAVDSNGCAATHPISAQPGWRPPTTGSSSSPTAACQYAISGDDPRLLSSIALDEQVGRRLEADIAAAPAGSGPNLPQNCLPEVSYGDRVIVLLPDQTVIRWDGCDHKGVDDGRQVRRLTSEVHGAVTTGPNKSNYGW